MGWKDTSTKGSCAVESIRSSVQSLLLGATKQAPKAAAPLDESIDRRFQTRKGDVPSRLVHVVPSGASQSSAQSLLCLCADNPIINTMRAGALENRVHVRRPATRLSTADRKNARPIRANESTTALSGPGRGSESVRFFPTNPIMRAASGSIEKARAWRAPRHNFGRGRAPSARCSDPIQPTRSRRPERGRSYVKGKQGRWVARVNRCKRGSALGLDISFTKVVVCFVFFNIHRLNHSPLHQSGLFLPSK